MSDTAEKLSDFKMDFKFSRPIAPLAFAIDSWRGAGLTHIATDGPFDFAIENNTLHLMSLDGGLTRMTRSGSLDLGRGFYSNIPGEELRGGSNDPIECISLFIVPSMLESVLDIKYTTDITVRNLRSVRSSIPLAHLMRALLQDVQAGSPSGPLLGEQIVAAIINIAHPMEVGKKEMSDRRKAHLPLRQLKVVKEMIHGRISKPVHVDDLAKAVNMSSRHFSRAFRGSTDLSPYQYILRARVDRARDIISRSSLSYDEIAWSAGFADRNHMATAFRKVLGVSPSHFRQV